MRPALDKLRQVLVALTHDGHTSAHLLREALADLEREDAARRSFSAALPKRIGHRRDDCLCGVPNLCGMANGTALCPHPARHVPVVPGAHLYRNNAADRGASVGLADGCDCGGPDQCDTSTLPVGVACRLARPMGSEAVDLLPALGTADVDPMRGDS